MKTVPYTDVNDRQGFLNPESVSHWFVSGPDEILVHFARGGPIAIKNYTAASFRQAMEN